MSQDEYLTGDALKEVLVDGSWIISRPGTYYGEVSEVNELGFYIKWYTRYDATYFVTWDTANILACRILADEKSKLAWFLKNSNKLFC